MLAPGMLFVGTQVDVTIGAAQAPNFINEGIGFMNDGSLAIDSDAPAGEFYKAGLRLNAAGAIYGTTVAAAGDVWNEGVRMSSLGQLVYEVAAAVAFNNGNPLTAAGLFAVV